MTRPNYLTLSSVCMLLTLAAVATTVQAGDIVCQQQFSYAVPNRGVAIQQHHVQQRVQGHAYQQGHHQGQHHHQNQNGVIGALQEIAREKQEYSALIEGLRSLGFASAPLTPLAQPAQGQSYSQSQSSVAVTPYAQAPYQQGTTAYSVREVEVDAFGPKDVRELMAAVSRYSSEANTGANQLMHQANEITSSITSSVHANTESALRVAAIEAETRGIEATTSAVVEALRLTRPQQSAKVTVRTESEGHAMKGHEQAARGRQPADGTFGASQPKNPSPDSDGMSVALLKSNCVSCHGSNVADPPGGFRLSQSMVEGDVEKAAFAVLNGTMPKESSLSTSDRLKIVAELQHLMK